MDYSPRTYCPIDPYVGIIRIRFNGCNLRPRVFGITRKRSTTPVNVLKFFQQKLNMSKYDRKNGECQYITRNYNSSEKKYFHIKTFANSAKLPLFAITARSIIVRKTAVLAVASSLSINFLLGRQVYLPLALKKSVMGNPR